MPAETAAHAAEGELRREASCGIPGHHGHPCPSRDVRSGRRRRPDPGGRSLAGTRRSGTPPPLMAPAAGPGRMAHASACSKPTTGPPSTPCSFQCRCVSGVPMKSFPSHPIRMTPADTEVKEARPRPERAASSSPHSPSLSRRVRRATSSTRSTPGGGRARELADLGLLLRLWALPGDAGLSGLWRAGNAEEMDAILGSLPAAALGTGRDHRLAPHPSDPGMTKP